MRCSRTTSSPSCWRSAGVEGLCSSHCTVVWASSTRAEFRFAATAAGASRGRTRRVVAPCGSASSRCAASNRRCRVAAAPARPPSAQLRISIFIGSMRGLPRIVCSHCEGAIGVSPGSRAISVSLGARPGPCSSLCTAVSMVRWWRRSPRLIQSLPRNALRGEGLELHALRGIEAAQGVRQPDHADCGSGRRARRWPAAWQSSGAPDDAPGGAQHEAHACGLTLVVASRVRRVASDPVQRDWASPKAEACEPRPSAHSSHWRGSTPRDLVEPSFTASAPACRMVTTPPEIVDEPSSLRLAGDRLSQPLASSTPASTDQADTNEEGNAESQCAGLRNGGSGDG